MIDQAGIMMAQGLGTASERIQGVNDNMSQSHYHEYFEIYYLEAGERFHMVEDQLYHMEQGEFMIFPPYVMHHSYGEKNVPFKRLVLYFTPEEVLWPSILTELKEEIGCLLYTSSDDQLTGSEHTAGTGNCCGRSTLSRIHNINAPFGF